MKWQINVNQHKDYKVETTASHNEMKVNDQTWLFEMAARGERHFIVQLADRNIEVFVLKYDAATKKGTFMVNGKKCVLTATDEMGTDAAKRRRSQLLALR